jgi:WD40 repeat protein
VLKRFALLLVLVIGCAEDAAEPVDVEGQLGPSLLSSSVQEDGTLLLTFSKPVSKVTVDGTAATLTDDATRARADVGDGKLDVAWTGAGGGTFREAVEFAMLVSSSVQEDGTLLLTFSKPVDEVTVDGIAATLTDDATRARADVGDGKLDVAWIGRGGGRFRESLQFAVPGDIADSTDDRTGDDVADEAPEFGSLIATLHGHSTWVRSVTFSPDGATLASGSLFDDVYIWDIAAQQKTHMIRTGFPVAAVAFSPDGSTLAIAGGTELSGTVTLVEVATLQEIATQVLRTDVASVAFSPDGSAVAFGNLEYMARWNLATGRVVRLFRPANWVTGVAFSPDSAMLAGAAVSYGVSIWDVDALREITILQESQTPHSVAFSPDGTTLASGGGDNIVWLWDVVTWQSVGTLVGHSAWVRSVAYAPDGTMLASGGDGGTVRIWDTTSGQEIAALSGRNRVESVAFSPDGTMLVSGSDDALVKLWYVGR